MIYHDAADETVERYVAGSLAEPESSAFERHLLICDECRAEVRLGSAIRSELARPLRSRNPWVFAAGAALAAGLVLTFVRLPDSSAPRFGAVSSPPGYEGVPVRATNDAVDVAFSGAMSLYKRGAFRESADGFRAVRAASGDSVTATFFLGASLLMAGRSREAADEFGRVGRMGRTAYSAESHYYRAKALLQLGNRDDALTALRAAMAEDSAIRVTASALADSVEGAR